MTGYILPRADRPILAWRICSLYCITSYHMLAKPTVRPPLLPIGVPPFFFSPHILREQILQYRLALINVWAIQCLYTMQKVWDRSIGMVYLCTLCKGYGCIPGVGTRCNTQPPHKIWKYYILVAVNQRFWMIYVMPKTKHYLLLRASLWHTMGYYLGHGATCNRIYMASTLL